MATIAQYLTQLKQIRADLETAITMIGGTPGPEFSSFATAIQGRAINIFAALEFITGEAAESIDEALQSILASKEALGEAITDKGGTLAADAPLSDYADAVDSIPTGGSAELPAGVCFAYSQSTSIDLSGFTMADLATRTNAGYMFYNSSNLLTVTFPEGFGAALVDIYYMFNNCVNLDTVTFPAGFGAAATNAAQMFRGCNKLTSVTFPAGFGANLTQCGYLLASCSILPSVTFPAGFGANLVYADNMFSGCSALTSVTFPAGFGANLTNVPRMFYYDVALRTLSKFSLASITNESGVNQMFQGCQALENVGGFTGLKVSLSLAQSSALTLQSIVNIVTEAAAVTTAKTLTLHATAYARAQADTDTYEYDGNTYTGIIALANAKGWTIASA